MIQLSLLDMLENNVEEKEDTKATFGENIKEVIQKIKSNPLIFKEYPVDKQTYEIALEAFKAKRENIEYVREDLLTERFWLESLNTYRDVLKEVVQYGEETEAIVMESINIDPITIGLSELQPREACLRIAETGKPKIFNLIKDLKEEYCIRFVEQDGHLLGEINNEEAITEKVCIAAIKENPYSIQWVPNRLLTEELEMLAVELLPGAIDFVINQTEQICWKALELDINTFRFLRNPTMEMVRHALRENRHGIKFCETIKTERAMEIIEMNPELIFRFEYITEEMYIKAIQEKGTVFERIEDSKVTVKMCEEAIKIKPTLLKHVPENLMSVELCMLAYTYSPETVKYFQF